MTLPWASAALSVGLMKHVDIQTRTDIHTCDNGVVQTDINVHSNTHTHLYVSKMGGLAESTKAGQRVG